MFTLLPGRETSPVCVFFNDLPNGHLHWKSCCGSANYCWIVGKWSFRSGCELSWSVWEKQDCIHACTHAHLQYTHSPLHTHTHTLHGDKDGRIHQSLSHSEGGSLKEAVSSLSLTVPLLLCVSSISLSVTLLSSASSGLPRSLWPFSSGLTFSGSFSCLHLAGRGWGAGCYQTSQMVGSSLGLETRTGANPPAKLVDAAAGRSAVGSSSTTPASPPHGQKR